MLREVLRVFIAYIFQWVIRRTTYGTKDHVLPTRNIFWSRETSASIGYVKFD
jgi:hypothetical protein